MQRPLNESSGQFKVEWQNNNNIKYCLNYLKKANRKQTEVKANRKQTSDILSLRQIVSPLTDTG